MRRRWLAGVELVDGLDEGGVVIAGVGIGVAGLAAEGSPLPSSGTPE